MKRIWHEYHVYVTKKKNSDDIVHQAIVFVINGEGYESDVYSTPMSYESVGDQARMLAKDISQQLPGQTAGNELTQSPCLPEAVELRRDAGLTGGAHPCAKRRILKQRRKVLFQGLDIPRWTDET